MTIEKLRAENEELRRRLEEAEETTRAIQSGAVDAFVVEESEGHRVYTLEAADRPYRLFVELMHQGAATVHADGTIAYANRQLSDLLDVPLERLVGATFADFVAAEDRAVYESLLRQGREQSGRGEARLRRASGELVPAYLTFSALLQDSGGTIGVLVTDLTAQRHHEQLAAAHLALRESEQRFRLMADAVPVLVWVSDDDSKARIWFNRSWLDFSGRPMQALAGDGWAENVHPDDLSRCVDEYARRVEAREAFVLEYRLRRHDGEYRWLADYGVPRFDSDGKFAGFIGSCVDFTDRKRAETDLRQVAADLSLADRRKNEFLAMLAHELRNPLAPVHNAVQILRLTGGTPEATRSAVDMLERQVGQMVRVVDDLLDVSRISRGTIELRRERIELASVVNHAVEAARPLVESMRHDLTVALPSEPIALDADPTRLAQVVGNLLNNACKFTDDGGRIQLTVEREGAHALIRVEDNGIGIPASQLPHIFEMFTQVDTSLERTRSGLGIGLTLAKKLVEMHGGTVEARSGSSGRGSEFLVRLPIFADASAPSHEHAGGEPTVVPARRILVVDDNYDSAISLAALLNLTGHETRLAHDGLDAVQAAGTFQPDLVLLDIGLPRLNGYEVARKIREQSAGREMLLVAVTGWGQEEDRRRSHEAGFDRHMVKPVDYPALLKILASLSTRERE